MIAAARITIGIVTIIALLRCVCARPIDLSPIKAGPLFRITQQAMRSGDLLEAVFRGLVARIEVRVQFLRQFPISLADL